MSGAKKNSPLPQAVQTAATTPPSNNSAASTSTPPSQRLSATGRQFPPLYTPGLQRLQGAVPLNDLEGRKALFDKIRKARLAAAQANTTQNPQGLSEVHTRPTPPPPKKDNTVPLAVALQRLAARAQAAQGSQAPKSLSDAHDAKPKSSISDLLQLNRDDKEILREFTKSGNFFDITQTLFRNSKQPLNPFMQGEVKYKLLLSLLSQQKISFQRLIEMARRQDDGVKPSIEEFKVLLFARMMAQANLVISKIETNPNSENKLFNITWGNGRDNSGGTIENVPIDVKEAIESVQKRIVNLQLDSLHEPAAEASNDIKSAESKLFENTSHAAQDTLAKIILGNNAATILNKILRRGIDVSTYTAGDTPLEQLNNLFKAFSDENVSLTKLLDNFDLNKEQTEAVQITKDEGGSEITKLNPETFKALIELQLRANADKYKISSTKIPRDKNLDGEPLYYIGYKGLDDNSKMRTMFCRSQEIIDTVTEVAKEINLIHNT